MKENHALHAGVAVALALTGLAAVAVLLSRGAQTGSVLTSIGQAIQQMLCVAASPVAGGGCITSVSSTITFPGFPGGGRAGIQ